MNGKLSSNNQRIIKENLRLQCITILIEAYKIFVSLPSRKYDNDWDEDQFSAYIYEYMKEQPLTLNNQWIIAPQTPLYTKEVSSGKIHVSKAKRPDFMFARYHSSSPKPFSFYIEAKNISENDWQKKCGSEVKASKQRSRYIDTGIKHFKEAIYPDGCLAGYVVQGSPENSVDKLNELLEKRGCKDEILIKNQIVSDFDTCYISIHPISHDNSARFILKHIFLKF